MGEGEGWDVVHDVTRTRGSETAAKEKEEGKGKGRGGPVQVGPSRFPRQTHCKRDSAREQGNIGSWEMEKEKEKSRRAYFDQGCRITE